MTAAFIAAWLLFVRAVAWHFNRVLILYIAIPGRPS